MLGDYKLNPRWIQAMELEELIKAPAPESTVPTKIMPVMEKNVVGAVENARNLADSAMSLESLRSMVMSFNDCELKKGAVNTVFGDGTFSADIMLIGEAPGATEDEKGIPFCGESGKLLDNILASIGLFRNKNFYITNTVFWRPPGNRPPSLLEIEICKPFVEKLIALIKPKLIILVGSTAVTSLIGNNAQISKIRQENYQYINKYLKESITTTAIFHPAYLLRQQSQKKATWYDLLKIKKMIESKNLRL